MIFPNLAEAAKILSYFPATTASSKSATSEEIINNEFEQSDEFKIGKNMLEN